MAAPSALNYCSTVYTAAYNEYTICTAFMQNNGMDISWSHLLGLFEASTYLSQSSQGLSLIPKLSREHLYLTGYSRMRVDLAAQVRFLALLIVVIRIVIMHMYFKPVAGVEFNHSRRLGILWQARDSWHTTICETH